MSQSSKSINHNPVASGLRQMGIPLSDQKSRLWGHQAMAEMVHSITLAHMADANGTKILEMTKIFATNAALGGSSIWSPDKGEAILKGLELEPFQILWIWGAWWKQAAFPRICWHSPQYVASLLATSGVERDPELIAAVVAPWKAFYISVPEPLIFVDHSLFGPDPVVGVMVVAEPNRWSFFAESENGAELWRFGFPTEELLDGGKHWIDDYAPHSKLDERATMLIGRLILGTCLTLSDPSKVQKSSGRSQRRAKKEHKPVVFTQNYVLGAPVMIDARAEIAHWARSGRAHSSPSVRTLVRGHWRNQACGKGRLERKIIHIQPFWKGPEDGPVVVREHRVKTDD